MGRIAASIAGLGYWLMRQAGEPIPDRAQPLVGSQMKSLTELYKGYGRLSYDKLIARYVSWVYACANINSTTVASVPLRLYVAKSSKGQKIRTKTKAVPPKVKDYLFSDSSFQTKLTEAVDVEEVLVHPFLDLMQNVNPYMNAFDLIEQWTLYQELTGNCYTLIIYNSLRVPIQLWVLPPQWMKILPSKEKFVGGYDFTKDPMNPVYYAPEEILHMKYPNPADVYYGKGPLAAAVLAADAHQGMSDYEYNLLINNAIPPSALTTEQSLTPDQVKKIKAEWNAQYRGTRNSTKLSILQGGLDIKQFSLSPKEMGYLLGRKINRTEIAAVFGVPMSLLTAEDIKAAPVMGQVVGGTAYARRSIRPRCIRIEQKMNEQLLPLYDPKLFVAFDNPVPEDKAAALLEREKNIEMGYTTINEERAEDNREPVEWGEMPWLPANLIQVGEERPTSLSSSPSLSRGVNVLDRTRPPFVKWLDPDNLPPPKDSLASILRQVFKEQKAEVELNARNVPSYVYKRANLEMWLINEEKWNKILAGLSKDDIAKLVAAGGKRGMRQLRLGMSFDVDSPEAQAFVKKHSFKFAKAVNKETNDKLRLHFSQGLAAGESTTELRTRVMEKVFGDEITKNRAEMIARTESARAMMAGTEEAWKSAEVVMGKEWNGAADMCEFCQAMNAQFGPGTGGVSLGSTFVGQDETVTGVDGGSLSTSYAAISYPPIHPNCLLPGQIVVAPDIVSAFRATYSGEVIELRFANGRELTVTPNHLLLTTDGFASAKSLCEGDDVLDCSSFEGVVPSNPDAHWQPALVEDIFTSLVESPGMKRRSVPMAPEYLHGDARRCNGNIDVVTPNGFLWKAGKTKGTEHSNGLTLYTGNAKPFDLAGPSNLTPMLLSLAGASDRIMGGRTESLAFSRRSLAHAEVHSLAAAPGFDTGSQEPLTDSVTVNTKSLRSLLLRHSSLIKPNKIVYVNRYFFSGHVYDLQSRGTLYTANGVLSSNCRCDLLPVLKEA